MLEPISEFFSSEAFMPHGHCYLWQPGLLWLQVLSNGLVGVAYVVIAATLAYLVKKGNYLPFKGMALAFGIFIISCGITHFMDVLVIWEPVYWVDGGIRAVTAIASVGTALMLPPLVPKAVALARGAKAAREKGVELEAAVEGLGQLVEKTRELAQLKTQFFANVSHELRTPLALILGPTEKLVAADNLTQAQRHDAEVVLRNARTLLKHVNDLLDVSRIEAGKLEPSYARVDLGAMLRLVASNFDALAAERGVDYRIVAPSVVMAEVDPDKIQRVILNLLSNAFKFSRPGGKVRCELRPEGDGHFVLEVADDGPGVRPEQREAVFDRFQQADAGSTREFGGTGLGLAIVRDFVQMHGGTARVDDAPEGGALFQLELPLRAPDGVVVEHSWSSRDTVEQTAATQHALAELRARTDAADTAGPSEAPLVLVVEDNPDMNRFVCETLQPEYRTASAADGEEGLQRAMQWQPDLIVSDIMMPRMSGEQLVDEVRARDDLRNVPILLLSAKADEELRVRLLREGAQDYVTKPFSADELRARVGNLVEMKRARDVLQAEIETQLGSLESLAVEVTGRKRDLKDALDAMRVARHQAERASQLKSDFLAVVSHELRSPLASLHIQLERLKIETEQQDDPNGTRELADRMARSTDRLTRLIDELLHYTRVQSGRVPLEIGPIGLGALATEEVEHLRLQAEAKSVSLTLEQEAQLPVLQSDARSVRLIVANLVGNAVKYTDQGGVTVSLAHERGRHRISVHDTGPGIPSSDQGRIFEPFEQIGQARKKSQAGVGLGLALVREMTRSLRGTIEIESEVGRGSTFTVRLPSLAQEGAEIGQEHDDRNR